MVHSSQRRFCYTPEISNYINGDEKSGEKLESKAIVHAISDVTIAHFGMKASQEFAKIHLDQRIGSFFAKAFERTSIGCDGALEILNRVSPKYTQLLTDLINKYDSSVAIAISYIYETESVSGVENALNNIENNSLYREIINETDTVNLNGKTVHIAKQSVHDVENAMNSILENYNTGDLAKGAKSEANTAKFIMDNNLDTIEQFRLKIFENINGKQGN